MPHVVAAHDVGAVGQTARMLVVGRAQQQRSGIDRAAGDDYDIRGIVFRAPLRSTTTLLTSRPDGRFPGASPVHW